MLDFYLISDEAAASSFPGQSAYAGAIDEAEFVMAQQVGLLDHHTDYYDDFRWTSEQVGQKLFMLASCPMRDKTAFQEILTKAQAFGLGLLAVAG